MNVIRYVTCYSGNKLFCAVYNTLQKNGVILYASRNIFRHLSNASVETPLHQTSHTIPGKQIENSQKNVLLKKNVDLSKGPGLVDFIKSDAKIPTHIEIENVPYLSKVHGNNQKVYLDIYGCQMNVSDAEVILSILTSNGYLSTNDLYAADVILLVTCAIRENAEQKIWNRLKYLRHLKTTTRRQNSNVPIKVGLLGCMAERLKHKIIEEEKMVDIVAGPDSYKDLPRLLAVADSEEEAVNVALSFDETYADITPVRLNPESKSAFVTIMRGCDNMCTYCIVPFTRGRERSRPVNSILDEIRSLSSEGVKEVTLLGQNVNSYRDTTTSDFYTGNNKSVETNLAKGFKTVYKKKKGGLRFSDLLDKVSSVDPEMRIRFTSPHPKDFPDEVLQLIAERQNVCRQLHLPVQSGNSAVLERMRRGYTREAYLELVEHVREILPGVSLSSDFIVGFCDETEEEFQDTLSLIQEVKYNKAFLFSYSMREKTTAHRRFQDNIPDEVKNDRLRRMITLYHTEAEKVNKEQIGQHQLILVEGVSKRSKYKLQGRNDGGLRVIFSDILVPENQYANNRLDKIKTGDYVVVKITDANSAILFGEPLYLSSMSHFFSPIAKKINYTL